MEDRKLTKNLARCKPSEGFAQMVKIRKLAEKWINEVGFSEIYHKTPVLKQIKQDMSADEIQQLQNENKQLVAEQGLKNLFEMFDGMFEKYPQDTLSLIALCCFVEPEHVDDYEIADYLDAFYEMMNNKVVINFFTLLLSSGQMISSRVAKQ